MPRVFQGTIATPEPIENNPKVTVVTTVSPLRGPKRGGIRVLVTGWNIYPPFAAYFGTKECTDVRNVAKGGRSFSCIAPSGTGKVLVIETGSNPV